MRREEPIRDAGRKDPPPPGGLFAGPAAGLFTGLGFPTPNASETFYSQLSYLMHVCLVAFSLDVKQRIFTELVKYLVHNTCEKTEFAVCVPGPGSRGVFCDEGMEMSSLHWLLRIVSGPAEEKQARPPWAGSPSSGVPRSSPPPPRPSRSGQGCVWRDLCQEGGLSSASLKTHVRPAACP